jgi:hypothetical protein
MKQSNCFVLKKITTVVIWMVISILEFLKCVGVHRLCVFFVLFVSQ